MQNKHHIKKAFTHSTVSPKHSLRIFEIFCVYQGILKDIATIGQTAAAQGPAPVEVLLGGPLTF